MNGSVQDPISDRPPLSVISKTGTSVTRLANTLEIKPKLAAVVRESGAVFELESTVETGKTAVDEGDGDGVVLIDGVLDRLVLP